MKDETHVKEWLEYAKRDYDSALHLFENMTPPPLKIICFDCQQAAEKHLKALLTACGIKFGESHDLPRLIKLQTKRSTVPAKVLAACADLNSYGPESIYPGSGKSSLAKTKKALKSLNTIMAWTSKELKNLCQVA